MTIAPLQSRLPFYPFPDIPYSPVHRTHHSEKNRPFLNSGFLSKTDKLQDITASLCPGSSPLSGVQNEGPHSMSTKEDLEEDDNGEEQEEEEEETHIYLLDISPPLQCELIHLHVNSKWIN